jgi:hypothetical protein
VRIHLPAAAADKDDDGPNADPVMDMHPNAGAMGLRDVGDQKKMQS